MSTKLELKGITKAFAGSVVLDNIDLSFDEGELHALVGENGAGKSTLIKIISGVYKADGGMLFLNDIKTEFHTPNAAQQAGISTLFQEIQEIPEMTVAENVFLGREPKKNATPFIDWKKLRLEAKELFDRLGINVDASAKMSDLPVSTRKMVEIARAFRHKASVVIMDEPTANLNENEMRLLFNMIDELKKNKTTIIYISHRLNEVFRISDRVTVLRDGKLIETLVNNEDCNEKRLVSLMIGRELTEMYPSRSYNIGNKTVLDVKGLSLGKFYKDVSFELRSGEIIGFAGLESSGANAVTKTLFGLCGAPDSGKVVCDGKEVVISNPAASIERGIAFLPEDRKSQGLFLNQNLVYNLTTSTLKSVFRKGVVLDTAKEKSESLNMVKKLNVKAQGMYTRLSELSGGNQQKILLGRWMIDNYKVLIMEEPTRGVDVGAKTEIYHLINDLAENGLAVIMYSTEMPELLGMCDRILVFSTGKMVATLSKEEATQELIIKHALVR